MATACCSAHSTPLTRQERRRAGLVQAALSLPDSTTNQDKLDLYGLFKQSKEGDCSTSASRSLSAYSSRHRPTPAGITHAQ